MQLRKAGLMIERAQCRPQKWISYNYIYIITTICGVFLAASIFSKPGWHHKCLECRAQEIVIIGSLGIQKWWDGPLRLGWKINLYLDSWSLMIVFVMCSLNVTTNLLLLQVSFTCQDLADALLFPNTGERCKLKPADLLVSDEATCPHIYREADLTRPKPAD